MAETRDLRVYVLLLKQDDPHKCTAAKLAKFGFAKPLFNVRQIPKGSLILNPMAARIVLPNDRNLGSVVAIDCSWEKAQAEFRRGLPGLARRLPTLLAANPTNYAKKHKLSSVEALAAASFIMGYKGIAEKLLSLFKWGDTFLTLNKELLEAYSRATSEEELSEIESEFF
jgi:pre-rRNA-processing protein TSR3